MGDKAGTSMNPKALPPGYTPNHGNFLPSLERYRKKAGGIVGNAITTVQVKVTMVRPIMKPSKVALTPINEVTLVLMTIHWV